MKVGDLVQYRNHWIKEKYGVAIVVFVDKANSRVKVRWLADLSYDSIESMLNLEVYHWLMEE